MFNNLFFGNAFYHYQAKIISKEETFTLFIFIMDIIFYLRELNYN